MAVLIKEKQLDIIRSGWLGGIGYSYPAAATSDVTAALTTLLATAGDGATALPVQVSTGITLPGVVTTAPLNYVHVKNNADQKPLADALGNEVYGRITEAVGVYSVDLFTLIAGVETSFVPVSPVVIDFYFGYRFTAEQFPTDNAISSPVAFLFNDPTAVITQQENQTELLTVTAIDTLSVLSQTPDVVANIILFVNGQAIDSFGGGSAPFTAAGVNLTWLAANAGFNLVPGDRVVASYTFVI